MIVSKATLMDLKVAAEEAGLYIRYATVNGHYEVEIENPYRTYATRMPEATGREIREKAAWDLSRAHTLRERKAVAGGSW